jgi:oligopeptide/dipeptide ABC transporter ATP-binding protein
MNFEAKHNDVLLNIEGLCTGFSTDKGDVQVVRNISLSIRYGETVALVGESGCGKSVTALSITRLLPEHRTKYSGKIVFNGRDLLQSSVAELRQVRGQEIAYIFQDPATALNPVLRIGFQLREAIRRSDSHAPEAEEGARLLELVGLPDPKSCLNSYPHELSGGMQQRVMIAMALASRPKLLIADEPTTALDVTIQAQILDILKRLRTEFNTAILLITHNLGLVADCADRLNVMYAGTIVESGDVVDILTSPAHPYTKGLLQAVPSMRSASSGIRMQGIDGTVPSPDKMPAGCPFAPRCTEVLPRCETQTPPISCLTDTAKHCVRCFSTSPTYSGLENNPAITATDLTDHKPSSL